MAPELSIVIPVYKAEACLHELYRRLCAALEALGQSFEIVLVEDCGGDRSWSIIRDLAQADPRVRGLQFSRNFGQHYGITAGLDVCRGNWAVVMDCDLQDRPEDIGKLYAKAQQGYDVVLAMRSHRQERWSKRLSSWLFYKVFNYFTDLDYDGRAGNFRIVSRKVVETLRTMRENLRFFGGLVSWMGFPTALVEVQQEARFAGSSAYTFRRLWRLGSEIIIAHSDKPLRLAIRFGFAISLLAFFYGSWIGVRALVHGSSVSGWSSLIVSLYFLTGIIISILGLLGVYLGKTFDEVKRRPLYVVREATFAETVHPPAGA